MYSKLFLSLSSAYVIRGQVNINKCTSQFENDILVQNFHKFKHTYTTFLNINLGNHTKQALQNIENKIHIQFRTAHFYFCLQKTIFYLQLLQNTFKLPST